MPAGKVILKLSFRLMVATKVKVNLRATAVLIVMVVVLEIVKLLRGLGCIPLGYTVQVST